MVNKEFISILDNYILDRDDEEARRINQEEKEEDAEDCISRKAVNVLVDELARAISDERCCMSRGRSTATIMQDILDLSSVAPTGKWIDMGNEGLVFKCSLCENKNMIESHYCPNCGARMTESEK